MSIRSFSRWVCICACYLTGAATQAGVIEPVDVFAKGDGAATYVEATGLNWLDLSFTVGLSYQEVQSDPTLGGILNQAWRIAELSEVDALFTEYGFVPDANCANGASHCSDDGESRPVVAAIISDFDSPSSVSFGGFFTNPNAGNGLVGQAYADSGTSVDATTEQLVPWTSKAGQGGFNGYGTLLVSAGPVPEPSVTLLLAATGGILSLRRHQKIASR